MERENQNQRSSNQNQPLSPTSRTNIPTGYGGPVKTPNKNDVLSGRGGGVNGHTGNKRYRTLANSIKAEYLSPKTRKMQKQHIAANVVIAIRQSDPPGRFLKINTSTGMWYEIGDKAAIRKTGQTLRENSSSFRLCWRDIMLAEDGRKAQVESAKTSEV